MKKLFVSLIILCLCCATAVAQEKRFKSYCEVLEGTDIEICFAQDKKSNENFVIVNNENGISIVRLIRSPHLR